MLDWIGGVECIAMSLYTAVRMHHPTEPAVTRQYNSMGVSGNETERGTKKRMGYRPVVGRREVSGGSRARRHDAA